MIAIQFEVNDEDPVVAGCDEGSSVLMVSVTKKGSIEELRLSVVATSGKEEKILWHDDTVEIGSEIKVRIVESCTVNDPIEVRYRDPDKDAEREKAYYLHLKEKYENE